MARPPQPEKVCYYISMKNSFKTLSDLQVEDKKYKYYDITKVKGSEKLPFSLKIILENLLRHEDGENVTADDINGLANWSPKTTAEEIAYKPARVLLQDFTGVPAIVDLAAMRDALEKAGKNPDSINPQQPVELVVDHSVQVDKYGSEDAYEFNTKIEYSRNRERYQFLKWGQSSFDNFKVVPPGAGIVHQVNLEFLARVAFTKEDGNDTYVYPDTLVGTDSHTTMVNGLGVLAWGVGGIEAEAAMLGQPISMLLPKVVGFKLNGEMKEGITATDLVLTITERLREHGVVGKFVEFYGPGIKSLTLADRATISNMAPEFGATCAIFPIDEETLRYLNLSNRDPQQIALVEEYFKKQGMFYGAGEEEQGDVVYSENIEFNLDDLEPSLAGPKRPQDRINLGGVKDNFTKALGKQPNESKVSKDGQEFTMRDGNVVIAAITSCTNTSNPYVMVAAGLLARNAIQLGMQTKPWVKTSLAPGSKVVTEYLEKAGLYDDLAKLGFNLAGYGCTTCIGNSGPLDPEISQAVKGNDLSVCAVLSGNRNFEGRVHPDTKMNYLASPPLVVAYALAGRVDFDPYKEPLGQGKDGKDIFLKDVWPSNAEVKECVEKNVTKEQFTHTYSTIFQGEENWADLAVTGGKIYDWDDKSSYVRKPDFFEEISIDRSKVDKIENARVLALFGDSITTDHISPAGSIKEDSPAGEYLKSLGIPPSEFNSYGSRRGNHEVMMRGTFANIRLRNELVPGTEGGVTIHLPDGKQTSIYDAAMQYKAAQTPTIVIAGKEYGTGSSRDWAAKGPMLLGVQLVIAESFERIHRTNLVGMGILPLQFQDGDSAKKLGLTGKETYHFEGIGGGTATEVGVTAVDDAGKETKFTARLRIDTPQEVKYYQSGGILNFVLKRLAA